MPYRRINIWQSVDWFTIILYVIMVLVGWFSIYAASYNYDHVGMLDLSGRSGMQMVWILTSVVLGLILLMIDCDLYKIFAYWVYVVIILLLIATIFLAPEIKGSRSWLVIGPINLQPAEFAKFATALALAKFMSSYRFKLLTIKNFSVCLMLIFLPMILILLQKETGSALVYLAFFIVLYREGMSGTILFIGFCMVLFFIIGVKYSEVFVGEVTSLGELIVLGLILLIMICLTYYYKHGRPVVKYVVLGSLAILVLASIVELFVKYDYCYVLLGIVVLTSVYLLFLSIKYWSRSYLLVVVFSIFSLLFLYSVDYVFSEVLEPHQQVRIQVALGMNDDPSGAGYNVNQSKIAIGSGGFIGKGFLNGTQTKLKYVPEQDTDFIFCTVGEEKGFIGASLVIILFAVMIVRLILLAERQKSIFNRVYGYSVASIMMFHFAINIGMVIGLTPVIGIPLPFFSYGGSSLWGFTILLFIFLRLDASRAERF